MSREVLSRSAYLDRWQGLHGGYDPRTSRLVGPWLTFIYSLARPFARLGVPPDVVTLLGLVVSGVVVAERDAVDACSVAAGVDRRDEQRPHPGQVPQPHGQAQRRLVGHDGRPRVVHRVQRDVVGGERRRFRSCAEHGVTHLRHRVGGARGGVARVRRARGRREHERRLVVRRRSLAPTRDRD